MRLLFRQRFFSWFDSYDIYNDNEETVYTVKGQLSNHEKNLCRNNNLITSFLPYVKINAKYPHSHTTSSKQSCMYS